MINNYREILNAVCEHYGYTIKQLISRKRQKTLVEARHIAIYMCRSYINMSYNEIGDIFNRDHSTIVHALHKHKVEERLVKIADYIARIYLKEY